nr:MltR family transcriptional regulator [Lichenihabitans psoromatis]
MSWDDTLADIRTGNSRIAAILAGSLVQMVLKVAVTYNMVPLTKAEDKNLFEGSGPLSTLSAQINVGYALGLFGKKVRHDLHVIRDIRNDFAHTLHDVTLEHADFAGRLAALHSVQLLPDKSDKPPADLLASAAELLCLS